MMTSNKVLIKPNSIFLKLEAKDQLVINQGFGVKPTIVNIQSWARTPYMKFAWLGFSLLH